METETTTAKTATTPAAPRTFEINGYAVKSLREYALARGRDVDGLFTAANLDAYVARAAVEWVKRVENPTPGFLADMQRLAETPDRYTDNQLAALAKWMYNDLKREADARERETAWQQTDLPFDDPDVPELECLLIVRENGQIETVPHVPAPVGMYAARLRPVTEELDLDGDSTENTADPATDGVFRLTVPKTVLPAIPDGYYTIVHEDAEASEHLTIRLRSDDRAGQQIASYLSGSDNTSDYTWFAFVRGQKMYMMRRFAENRRLKDALELLLDGQHKLAGKAYALASGNCWRCGRLLTDPESIERGVGPICAGLE